MIDYLVEVLDPSGAKAGQIEGWTKLDLALAFNDVSTWVLDAPLTPVASMLRQPGWGVLVTRAGQPLLSGPMTQVTRGSTIADIGADDTLQLSGVDDTVWLARRLAMPQPATPAPPYSASAYDVFTGPASTALSHYVDVNLGPNALPARQVPGLTLGSDLGVGASVTGRARFDTLLTFMQGLALQGGGVGFRLLRTPQLTFQTYLPADRSASAKISRDLGNLGDFSYVQAAPTGNYVVVAGGQQLTARVVVEGSDPASIGDQSGGWGRAELFVDRRDTTVPAELALSVTENLASNAVRESVQATPIDTPSVAWRVNYDIGDKITIIVDNLTLVDQIRSIAVTVDSTGELVRPSVATPLADDLHPDNAVRAFFHTLNALGARIANLEHNQ